MSPIRVSRTSDYERDAVIGRTWAGIAFTDTIPNRPFAQPIEFMGLPLLVVRDRHGALRVFHNVCSHRGMKLVAEPTEVRGLITCRYHCWAYATNGDLKATPHIGGVDQHHSQGFDNSTHGLKPVRSAVFLGILFVNMSGDAPAFEQHAAELLRRTEELLGPGGWSQLQPGLTDSMLSLTAQCNWKLAVENYCEAYHLPWVHPELNSYSRLEDHYCFLGADFAGQGSLAYRGSDIAGAHLPRLAAWPADRHARGGVSDDVSERVARLSGGPRVRHPSDPGGARPHSRRAADLLCWRRRHG